jgi:signal transduction histidine kinase
LLRVLDRVREWPAVVWARAPDRLSAGAGDADGSNGGAVAAALGLCAAGVAAPIAISVFPALRGLIATPIGTDILLALLMLAPAAVAFAVALVGLPQIATSLRRDSPAEAEQAILRVFADTALFAYALGSAVMAPTAGFTQPLPPLGALGLAAAWAVLLDLVFRPVSSPVRRRCATLLDILLLSAVLHFGEGPAAGWYPMYLAVIFYAGSRFGERALVETAALSIAGFGVVVLTTDFWGHQPSLVLGLLAALVVLPTGLLAALRAAAAARATAARAEAERRRSLGAIADALRRPLAMLRADPAEPATRLLSERIGDALDLAAIETGEFRIPVESFDLRLLAKETLRPLVRTAAENRVALRWRIDPRLPASLRGPAPAIARILGSLAGQLLDLASEGGLRIAFDLIERAADRVKTRIRIDAGAASGAADVLNGLADQPVAGWEQQALTVSLVTRLVAMIGGELSIEGGPGPPTRFVVTLSLGVEPRAAEADLDLDGQPVLIVSGDEAFAGELVALLDRWHADARWIGDVEATEGEIAGLDTLGRAVLIVDGRDHPLAGLAFAERIGWAGDGGPFILFVGESSRIDRLAQLDDLALDCLLPVPLTERLLANAFRGLPLEPPVLADNTYGSAAHLAEDDRVTPIAAHPKFVPDPAPALDIRAIDALRAAGGGDAFLRELIDTFRADAGELLDRMQQAAETGDALAFSRGLAALRRCAAHLGAKRFGEALPAPLTEIELRERGPILASRLTDEIDRLTAALRSFLPESEVRRS